MPTNMRPAYTPRFQPRQSLDAIPRQAKRAANRAARRVARAMVGTTEAAAVSVASPYIPAAVGAAVGGVTALVLGLPALFFVGGVVAGGFAGNWIGKVATSTGES